MSAPRAEDKLPNDVKHYRLEKMVTDLIKGHAEEFELSYHKVNLPLFDGIRNVFDTTALLVRAGYGDKLIKPRNGLVTFIVELKASRLIEALPLVLHRQMRLFGEKCLYAIWDERKKPQHLGFWVEDMPPILCLKIPAKTRYPQQMIEMLKVRCLGNDATKLKENVDVPPWASGDPFLELDWANVTTDWRGLLLDYINTKA